MRKVYQQLKKAGNKDVEDIMENGLRYMRTLHSQDTPEGALYSWQKTFPGKKTRKEVEASLEKLGFDQHEWLENGALRWHPRIILQFFLEDLVLGHYTTDGPQNPFLKAEGPTPSFERKMHTLEIHKIFHTLWKNLFPLYENRGSFRKSKN